MESEIRVKSVKTDRNNRSAQLKRQKEERIILFILALGTAYILGHLILAIARGAFVY